MPKAIKNPKKETWNLSPLYTKDDDPQIKKDMEVVAKANYKFINKWRDRDDYLKDPKVLRQALDELETIASQHGVTGHFGYYFMLRSAQEENNTKIKGIINQITSQAVKIENDSQFFELKLAKVPEITQKKFLKSPELAPYHHFLKKLFQDAKYLLTEPEEKIMNLKASPSHGMWTDMTSTLLAKQERLVWGEDGKKKLRSLAEITSLTASRQKKVRQSAFQAINEINERYSEVAEAEFNAILFNKKVNDELRGFDRPDKSRHISDDIETEVVDTLIKSVSEAFTISKDYYKLKANLFGKKKLDYPERNVPYGKIEKKYKWPEAVALTDEVLSKLDPEFGEIFRGFVQGGQIDIFPRQGKSSGAFCTYNLKSQPTYILLNYANKLNDVLTLAHEVGHGINDELMRRKQNAFYFSTPLSTAEVASTFMEDFVLEKLMSEADEELRLSLMMDKLNDDVSTIFRQVAAYRFEQEVHQEFRKYGYLSKEQIGQIFRKHMNNYLGSAVDQPKGVENLWVYWPHFRNFFYVYSYASGLLISKSLQAKVRENPEFIQQVKGFLEAGSSESPKEIFAKLGINITDPDFWQTGLGEIKDLLTETKKLAKKLGKIK